MDEFPVATSPAPGVMGVDWENRVDFERLRTYRLERVRMMLEAFDLGADLSTMFMVQYEPRGFAGAHDHPLEEAYLILEGEVEGIFDGVSYDLGPGDVAWAGVGCVHAFTNTGPGIVRWLETQAPQPPSRHSYRFARDWTYLDDALSTTDDTRSS